jgi:hypothetical protein
MADVVTETYERLFGGETNMSMTERGVSIALGLGLAAAAAKPRPNMWLNLLALVGGSVLALRGASGHCPVKAALTESDRQERPALEGDHEGPERHVPMARGRAPEQAGAYPG